MYHVEMKQQQKNMKYDLSHNNSLRNETFDCEINVFVCVYVPVG